MTSRARLSRRPLQVGGLLLAAVALGTVTAPAASAVVDPTAPADRTPEQAPAPAPRVLTSSPVAYLGSPEARVDFGVGKLQIYVAPAGGAATPAAPGMAGAQVEVTFPDLEDPEGDGTTITCTTDVTGLCLFPQDEGDLADGLLAVYPRSVFTVRQTAAPTSGGFALPAAEDAVVHGVGGFGEDSSDTPSVDGSPSVTRADTQPWPDGEDTVGRVTFYDPPATVSGGEPGDQPVAPAAPVPDSTAPAAPAAPAVPVAPAAATPAAAAPTLATTGFDAVPVALVGGGLLAAGAGAVAAGRRRAAR